MNVSKGQANLHKRPRYGRREVASVFKQVLQRQSHRRSRNQGRRLIPSLITQAKEERMWEIIDRVEGLYTEYFP